MEEDSVNGKERERKEEGERGDGQKLSRKIYEVEHSEQTFVQDAVEPNLSKRWRVKTNHQRGHGLYLVFIPVLPNINACGEQGIYWASPKLPGPGFLKAISA